MAIRRRRRTKAQILAGLPKYNRAIPENRIVRRFDSPEAFINYLDITPINYAGCLGSQSMSNKSEGSSWADTDNLSEAKEMAKAGKPKIASQIKPKDIALSYASSNISLKYDVAGEYLDIGRFLNNDPDCMVSRVKKGSPIINLLVNTGMTAWVTSEQVEDRGKAILEIMSGLEANGYSVDITLVMPRGNGAHSMQNYHRTYVKVKDSREYFNLPSLAFWLTSSSVNRRLNFRLLESEDTKIQEEIGSGYAATSDLDADMIAEEGEVVYFPKITYNQDYGEVIKETLEKYAA